MTDPHAYIMDDESVWIHFHGEVARVGDTVRTRDHEYRVREVFWLALGGDEHSAARVVLDRIDKEPTP